MNLLILLCYVIIILFSLASFIFLIQILRAYLWIKKNQNKIDVGGRGYRDFFTKIYIIIPVLDEKYRLEKTVDYFLDKFSYLKNIKLVIVTTQEEYKYSAKNNTIDLGKKIASKNRDVLHIHYRGTGKMAHQLNYAMKILLKKQESAKCMYAFYNADSRPHPNTFKWLLRYKIINPGANVFQQYGDYSDNLITFKGRFGESILLSAAAWQNRWSLGFEIPHALDQFAKIRYNKIFGNLTMPLNYCIGHGFICNKDAYLKIGGFSEDTHNEDAVLGLNLSYLNEKIIPIPFFDGSESPDSVKSLYRQKSNWFFGPLQAFQYMKKIKRTKNKVNALKLFVLSFKLFTHALRWVLGPTLMFVGFAISLWLFNLKLFLLMIIVFSVYLSLINYLSLYLVNSLNTKIKGMNAHLTKIMLGSIPCYFLHGLSAYRALIMILVAKLSKKNIEKGKTEMRQM